MASVNVTISGRPWRVLAGEALERLQGAAELARSGAELMEEKTEDVRSRARLEREVADLREEIDLQMQAVGEVMDASHRGRPSDSGCIQQILEYVDSLYEQLEAHQKTLAAAQGQTVCGACGAGNAPGFVYCQNCGQPLSR